MRGETCAFTLLGSRVTLALVLPCVHTSAQSSPSPQWAERGAHGRPAQSWFLLFDGPPQRAELEREPVAHGQQIARQAAQTHDQISGLELRQAGLLIRLADDGRGLAAPPDLANLSTGKHFGLLGISERVALLGGTLQIESLNDGGVILQVEIPSPYPSI